MKKISILLLAVTVLVISGCKKDNGGGGISLTGTWTFNTLELQMGANNTYQGIAGVQYTAGFYAVANNVITFTDTASNCSFTPSGTYKDSLYTLTVNSGYGSTTYTYLQLTLISDGCSFRAADMPQLYTKQ